MMGTSASALRAKIASASLATRSKSESARGHAVLDDFVESRTKLASRQRLQERRIDGDDRWMVERPDEILAERMVDAHLAANRAVDLREKRGRHLHERYAAQVRGGDEARHIADDAAADCNDGGATIGVELDQRLVCARDRRELFVSLAVRKQDRLGLRQRLRQALPWSFQTSGLEMKKRRDPRTAIRRAGLPRFAVSPNSMWIE